MKYENHFQISEEELFKVLNFISGYSIQWTSAMFRGITRPEDDISNEIARQIQRLKENGQKTFMEDK